MSSVTLSVIHYLQSHVLKSLKLLKKNKRESSISQKQVRKTKAESKELRNLY